MILYLLLTLVILYIVFFAFIKLRFRFWSSQPVFHIYNLYYWLWPCGVIQHGIPPKTKFYDTKIITQNFNKISAEKKTLFYTLIKSHYLNEKNEIYNPPKYGVLDFFESHINKSFLSLQFEYQPSKNFIQNINNTQKTLVSCMTSRPLNGLFNNNKVSLNYVDFLCVHKSYRKQGLAQKIIYSHYFNCRKDKVGPAFLFKREGIINFIVPLTVYNAYVFPLKHLKHPNLDLPNNIICHLINSSNFALFIDLFNEIKQQFKCCISPDLPHIKYLVSKKILFICLIMEGQMPIAAYIYKNPFTSYDGKKSIELIASYYKIGYYNDFIQSFRNTIALINKKTEIDLLILERISNNTDLNDFLVKKYPVLWKCPMAYFLYNFSYRPFYASDIFIIN